MNFIDELIKKFYLKLALKNLDDLKMEFYGKINFTLAYKYFLKISKNEPEKFGYENFIKIIQNRINEKKNILDEKKKDVEKFIFIFINKKKEVLLLRNFDLKKKYNFFYFFGNKKKEALKEFKKKIFLNFGISISSKKFENIFGFLKEKKIYLKNTIIYNLEEKEISNKILFQNFFIDKKLKWKNIKKNNFLKEKKKYEKINFYFSYIKNYFLEK